jgi:hypothetical protein
MNNKYSKLYNNTQKIACIFTGVFIPSFIAGTTYYYKKPIINYLDIKLNTSTKNIFNLCISICCSGYSVIKTIFNDFKDTIKSTNNNYKLIKISSVYTIIAIPLSILLIMPYFHTSLFYYHSFNQDYDNEDEE